MLEKLNFFLTGEENSFVIEVWMITLLVIWFIQLLRKKGTYVVCNAIRGVICSNIIFDRTEVALEGHFMYLQEMIHIHHRMNLKCMN